MTSLRALVLTTSALLLTASQAIATPPQPCLRQKLRASGAEVRGRLFCEARAIGRAGFDLGGCLAAVEAKRAAAFAALESKRTCAQTGDSKAAGGAAGDAVSSVMTVLTPHCGNGIVSSGEQCDGGAPPGGEPDGCFPPGDPKECQVCAQNSICFLEDGGDASIDCCGGRTCLVDTLVYPHKIGMCATSCTHHADCPSGELCFAGEKGNACLAPGAPCNQNSDCPQPFGACHPVYHVCGVCDPFGNCWGPITDP